MNESPLVGRSEVMRALDSEISRWATTPFHVLIEGETGTGKELVARELHRRSARDKRQLRSCNCAVLTETLLESQLFGHVKGSFTGATRDQDGIFVQANQSTLFLDEINSSSPHFQAKLLRAMEEKIIYRLGDPESKQVDVRILAATNIAIAKSNIRPDLVFRFHHVLRVPPLRARGPDDIELLAKHFIRTIGNELGCAAEVDDEALQPLFGHSWPGNIRELQNVVRRAIVEGREESKSRITRELLERALPAGNTASEEPTPAEQRCINAIADLAVAKFETGETVSLDGLTRAKSNDSNVGPLAELIVRGLMQAIRTYVEGSSKQRAQMLRTSPTRLLMMGLINVTENQSAFLAQALRDEISSFVDELKPKRAPRRPIV